MLLRHVSVFSLALIGNILVKNFGEKTNIMNLSYNCNIINHLLSVTFVVVLKWCIDLAVYKWGMGRSLFSMSQIRYFSNGFLSSAADSE